MVYEVSATLVAFIPPAFLLGRCTRLLVTPIVGFVVLATLLAGLYAWVTSVSLATVVGDYHRQSVLNPGGGDVISLLLGASVVSVAAELMVVHPVVEASGSLLALTGLVGGSVSLFASAGLARAVGLEAAWALPCALQGLPAPLAVPVATHLGVNPALTVVVIECGMFGFASCIEAVLGRLEESPLGGWVHDQLRTRPSPGRGIIGGEEGGGEEGGAEEEGEVHWTAVLLGGVCGCQGVAALAERGEQGAAAVATAAWLGQGCVMTALVMVPPVWDAVRGAAA